MQSNNNNNVKKIKKIRPEQNKKRKDAITKLQSIVRGMQSRKKNSTKNYVNKEAASSNAVDFRKYQGSNLKNALATYHTVQRDRYLAGLVHPDLAVKNQWSVKCFSDLPLPTATIGYHVQNQMTTSSLGTFLLSWIPCCMITKNKFTSIGQIVGNWTYNNAGTLTGNASSNYNYQQNIGYNPDVALQRYRLVSALARISYNGSVLNQAGTMLSCAVFDKFPIIAASAPFNSNLVDRYGNFSLIQNGLWNRTQDITSDSRGLEALYVPMDPDDFMFQNVDTFYGTDITAGVENKPDNEGAHVNYLFCGKNLPASSSCILVDFYYNFEVIADPSSAPILRGDSSCTDLSFRNKQQQLTTNMINTGSMIRESSEGKSWNDIFKEIASFGIKLLPALL